MIQALPDNNDKQILDKHIQYDPDISFVVSSKDGVIHYDISAPGTISQLLLMQKILAIEIDRLIMGHLAKTK
jgi:hypothetical protein